MRIAQRVFVVGCSRSGTTVFQSHLGRHPRVWTFPESNFYRKLLGPKPHKLRNRLGIVDPRRVKRAFAALRQEVDGFSVTPQLPVFSARSATGLFVDEIDRLALENGADVWLEKTPKHFLNIEQIERYIQSPKVIHLIRDGREVVASIVDRARRFPRRYGHQADPEVAIKLWNEAMRVAVACVHRDNHTVVVYEGFVAQAEDVLRTVCRFIDIDYAPQMFASHEISPNVMVAGEQWKAEATQALYAKPLKFPELFDHGERQSIEQRLSMDLYDELCRCGQGFRRLGVC